MLKKFLSFSLTGYVALALFACDDDSNSFQAPEQDPLQVGTEVGTESSSSEATEISSSSLETSVESSSSQNSAASSSSLRSTRIHSRMKPEKKQVSSLDISSRPMK